MFAVHKCESSFPDSVVSHAWISLSLHGFADKIYQVGQMHVGDQWGDVEEFHF